MRRFRNIDDVRKDFELLERRIEAIEDEVEGERSYGRSIRDEIDQLKRRIEALEESVEE